MMVYIFKLITLLYDLVMSQFLSEMATFENVFVMRYGHLVKHVNVITLNVFFILDLLLEIILLK